MEKQMLEEILVMLQEARQTIIENHFVWWVEGALHAAENPQLRPIIEAAIEVKTMEVDAIILELDVRIAETQLAIDLITLITE